MHKQVSLFRRLGLYLFCLFQSCSVLNIKSSDFFPPWKLTSHHLVFIFNKNTPDSCELSINLFALPQIDVPYLTAWRSNQSILKEISPEYSFIGRTDAEAETPVLWPPDAKNWVIGKDPDAGKDWGQEEKGTTEDEMVGWHHQLNGHEFEQTPAVGDGQESLVCCSLWDRKESDMTDWLNWRNWNT